MADNLQKKPQDIIDRKEFRKRYREFMKNNIHHMNPSEVLKKKLNYIIIGKFN